MEQNELFFEIRTNSPDRRTLREPFGRLDTPSDLRDRVAALCRLKPGEIWEDPERDHRVGLLDATSRDDVAQLCVESGSGHVPVTLAVSDPPYNIDLGGRTSPGRRSAGLGRTPLNDYLEFSRAWVEATTAVLAPDSHFYAWLGADVQNGFQPLPDFMVMMRDFADLEPRNFITLRNQRGYGTSRNWMWVRQELLHYRRGRPPFSVIYTDIPKILRGYYKDVGGRRTENSERGRGDTIRAGNVWVDIQQVFYRLHENVPGAYAQKPLAAISRIVESSSREGDTVLDLFSHSGTTLIAGELSNRRVFTMDNDPVFVELTIRRLEHLRETGEPGWQCGNPFPEVDVSAVDT